MSVEKMRDKQMTNAELLQEVDRLRKRVTELKHTQEALRESENKWRSLLNNTPDIVMIVDRNSTIRFINHTVPGIKEQEATGKRVYDYISPEHHDTMRKDLERVFQTGQSASQEISGVGPHGNLSWYQAELGPIKQDGRIVAVSIVTRDITKHKEVDQNLKAAKEHAELICRVIPSAIFAVDKKRRLTDWNNKAVEITGYAAEEVLGKECTMLALKPCCYKCGLYSDDVEKPIVAKECTIKTKGGEILTILKNADFLKDVNGNIIGGIESFEDITELKNTEQSLRESEERLRVALSAAQMGTWRWDPSTNQDTRDASLNAILGLEAVESTQPVDDFLQCVHPEDRDMVDTEIQRALREHCTYVAEFRIIRPDGTVRWLRDQGKPVYDENDHILYLTGAVVDITDRKRAEDALRESEKKYKALFQGAAEGIIVADTETKEFKYANPAICKMLGYTEEELERLCIRDIHPKEDLQHIISEFEKQAQREQTLTSNIPCLRKDGTIIYVDINKAMVLIDGRQCNVGFFTDITDRKEAVETLRESEERYRTLVESAGESIAMFDKDGVFLFINEIGAKCLCGKPEDYVGETMWDAFPKKIADRQMASVRKVISKGEGINFIAPTELQGQFRWFNTTIEPLRDSSGKVTAAMVIARDVHEQKQAEEELDLYREKMARAERLASVGTLSAIMAHTLNNPLTAIQLSIQNAMAESKKKRRQSTITKYLKDGLRSVSEVSSTVHGLGKFASESSKEIISEVNLKAVAERTVKLLSESARRTKVTLCLEGMEELPPIFFNKKDLDQLFFSLVENAIQAADGKKSHQLIISGAVKDKHIELRFTDDCCGIASENLDKIFELFFTTKPAGERTGLGLCIVERIVSGAGGNIRVESKAGKGSTFFVTLPISRGRRY